MIWFFERETERLQYEISREIWRNSTGKSGDQGGSEKRNVPPDLPDLPVNPLPDFRSQDVWMGLLSGGWRPLPSQDPASL